MNIDRMGSFLDRMGSVSPPTIASGIDEIVIFPAGNVEVFGDEDIIMDEASARVVIASFKDRGNKIPIDYEHSTLHKAGQGEPSPAAGWIVSMSWDPKLGLVGTVEWGSEARSQIKNGEYKYLSPHFRIDTDTRRVDHVLAVALTNTPRINNMKELVAASLAAAHLDPSYSKGETTMDSMKKRIIASLKLEDDATATQIADAVEEIVAAEHPVDPANPEGAENLEEEVVEPDVQKQVVSMAMEMQRLLVEAGLTNVDSSLTDAMQVVMDLIGKSAEETEAAASIAASLGLGKKSTTKEIIAAIDSNHVNSVPASRFKELREEVASLTAARDKAATETLVASFVESKQINPNSPKQMAWARNFAERDPDGFKEIAAGMEPAYEDGRQTPADVDSSGRATVIASLVKDHKMDGCGAGIQFYIDEGLKEKGLPEITDAECKTFAIA